MRKNPRNMETQETIKCLVIGNSFPLSSACDATVHYLKEVNKWDIDWEHEFPTYDLSPKIGQYDSVIIYETIPTDDPQDATVNAYANMAHAAVTLAKKIKQLTSIPIMFITTVSPETVESGVFNIIFQMPFDSDTIVIKSAAIR